MIKVDLLSWDSSFFGLRIGFLDFSNTPKKVLHSVLPNIIEEQTGSYELIYVKTLNENYLRELNTSRVVLRLVDEKLTFVADKLEGRLAKIDKVRNQVKLLAKNALLTDDLTQIALESGNHSRFKDPSFPEGSFERLYYTWIKRSISQEIADAVWISLCKNNVVKTGLITVSKNNQIATIGLLGVAKGFRGKGIGSDLVNTVLSYACENQCRSIMVSTQKTNFDAVSFYKAVGFQKLKKENIYHLWLKQKK